MPARVVIAKIGNLLRRCARDRIDRVVSSVVSSFGTKTEEAAQVGLGVRLESINDNSRETLALITTQTLFHRFDLLGSGWVDAGYEAVALGLEGESFAPDDVARKILSCSDPTVALNWANRRSARQFRALISEAYRPIDWHRDLRSGYRWKARCRSADIAIGVPRGADIKSPWELSRMQHLPQLALSALLSSTGDRRFRDPQTYVDEILDQIIDFISVNPPRFGPNWICPMDIGIRGANWVLSLWLLQQGGVSIGKKHAAVIYRSLYAHAKHISSNLEWSDGQRSNHYLSDIVGLLFICSSLPRNIEVSTWINFASRELASEILIQFHPDGGNYEGSTGYHRLSAELIVYGLALCVSLLRSEPSLFDCRDATILRRLRVKLPDFDRPVLKLLEDIEDRLVNILIFCEAIIRPDGQIIQIGDTDSGRLFKLNPVVLGRVGGEQSEIVIDDLVDAMRILLFGSEIYRATTIAGEIIKGFIGRRHAAALFEKYRIISNFKIENDKDIGHLEREILKDANGGFREFKIHLREGAETGCQVRAFPYFGLFILSNEQIYITFRCAQHDRSDAPTGHTHDDNLGLEVFDTGEIIVVDPGTYVYTPLPELRNEYRSAGAHFVPRAVDWEAAVMSNYLFELTHLAKASCLHASGDGLCGVLRFGDKRIYRLIRLEGRTLRIIDCLTEGGFRPISPPVNQCAGYGRRTSTLSYVHSRLVNS